MSENSKIELTDDRWSKLGQCLFPFRPRQNDYLAGFFQSCELQAAVFPQFSRPHLFNSMGAMCSSGAKLRCRPCAQYLLHDLRGQRLMHRRRQGRRGIVEATGLKGKISHDVSLLCYVLNAFCQFRGGIDGIANQCFGIRRRAISLSDTILGRTDFRSATFQIVLKEDDAERAADGNQRCNALRQRQPISAVERAHA